MPKNKKLDSSSESDSGPEDRNPAKKAKSDPPAKSSSSSSKSKSGGGGGGDGGEESWQLDKNRVVRINEFRGKVLIDIRELYMDSSGDLKPGKKGISLNLEQYRKLKEALPKVDEALKNK